LGMMIDGVQAVLEPLRQRGLIAKFA
jgi:hypothetical protein